MDTDTSAALQQAPGESRLAKLFVEAMLPSAPEKLRREAEDLARKEGTDTLDLLQQAVEREKSRRQRIKAQQPRRRQIKEVTFRFEPVDVWIVQRIWQLLGFSFGHNRALVIREVLLMHVGTPHGREAAKQMTKNEQALVRALDWGRMSQARRQKAQEAAARLDAMSSEQLKDELRAVLMRLDLRCAWE